MSMERLADQLGDREAAQMARESQAIVVSLMEEWADEMEESY